MWTLMFEAAYQNVFARLYHAGLQSSITTRQFSNLMLRELCSEAKQFMRDQGFWTYFHRNAMPDPDEPLQHVFDGELMLFMVFANQSPDDIISWINTAHPDDPCPVTRLQPDGPVQESKRPPSSNDVGWLQ
jgi:hypothetical protein